MASINPYTRCNSKKIVSLVTVRWKPGALICIQSNFESVFAI